MKRIVSAETRVLIHSIRIVTTSRIMVVPEQLPKKLKYPPLRNGSQTMVILFEVNEATIDT